MPHIVLLQQRGCMLLDDATLRETSQEALFWDLIAWREAPMAVASKASEVRASAVRRNNFTLLHIFSMGLRSGE